MIHFRAPSLLPVGTESWPTPPAEAESPPPGRVGRYQAPCNPEVAPPHTSHSRGVLVCSGTCTLCRPSRSAHEHTHTLGQLVKRHRCDSSGIVWSSNSKSDLWFWQYRRFGSCCGSRVRMWLFLGRCDFLTTSICTSGQELHRPQ